MSSQLTLSTVFEKSILQLLEDKTNHRLLIDDLFDFSNGKESFRFLLLSDYGKFCFLNELSDDDFLYVMKKFNKMILLKKDNEFVHVNFLFDTSFLFKKMKTALGYKKEIIMENNEILSFMSFKSLQILIKRKDLTTYEREILWVTYLCGKVRYDNLSQFSISSYLFLLKRDRHLISNLFQKIKQINEISYQGEITIEMTYDYFIENIIENFLSDFVLSYLKKHGVHHFDKVENNISKWLERFITNDIWHDSQTAEYVFNRIKKDIASLLSNDLPFLKNEDDLKMFLKDSIVPSSPLNLLTKFHFTEIFSNIPLPKLYFDENNLDLIYAYARLYLNIAEFYHPKLTNDEYSYSYIQYLNNIKINSKMIYPFLAFHYLCVYQPDDVFNQSNPYFLSESHFTRQIKSNICFLSISHFVNQFDSFIFDDKLSYTLKIKSHEAINIKKMISMFIDIDVLLIEQIEHLTSGKVIKNWFNKYDCIHFLSMFYFCDKTKEKIDKKYRLLNLIFEDCADCNLLILINFFHQECLPLTIKLFEKIMTNQYKNIDAQSILSFVALWLHVDEIRHIFEQNIHQFLKTNDKVYFNQMIYLLREANDIDLMYHCSEQTKKNISLLIDILNLDDKENKLLLFKQFYEIHNPKGKKEYQIDKLQFWLHFKLNEVCEELNKSFNLNEKDFMILETLKKPIEINNYLEWV